MKHSKQKEPETQTQIENPEILESNVEKSNESAANENEESTLEDEIQRVLEAAKHLPDLPPDARPNPEKSKNTDKPENSDETVDPVTYISATPESDSQDVPGLESVTKENPNLEITTKDKSTGKEDRSNTPHEPPTTSTPFQFNASPSKSDARLVSYL